MIEGIDIENLKRRIRIEHPQWADAGVHADARRILAAFDPRLKTALARYVREGVQTPCHGRGTSTADVMGRTGCTYIEALDVVSSTIVGRRYRMSHPVSTRFSNLSNREVSLLFSTQNWNSPNMDVQAKIEACQEVENRQAQQDDVAARTVIIENMDGPTYGYQSGSCIFLNSNVLEDGVFRTTSEDKDGNPRVEELPVSASSWQVFDTVCHEHSHGVDLDKGIGQTVSYVKDETDYDLYRIQADERKAYAVAEQKTIAALAEVEQALGKADPAQQAYLDAVARDSYGEALARAIEHYQDKDIQATLDKVCANFEKGQAGNYQSESAQRIEELLDAQLQQALGNGQENDGVTRGGTMNYTNDASLQGATQDQDLTGWEADLAALGNEETEGEGQQEGMDAGQDQGQDQDYDDGMGM